MDYEKIVEKLLEQCNGCMMEEICKNTPVMDVEKRILCKSKVTGDGMRTDIFHMLVDYREAFVKNDIPETYKALQTIKLNYQLDCNFSLDILMLLMQAYGVMSNTHVLAKKEEIVDKGRACGICICKSFCDYTNFPRTLCSIGNLKLIETEIRAIDIISKWHQLISIDVINNKYTYIKEELKTNPVLYNQAVKMYEALVKAVKERTGIDLEVPPVM